MRDILSPELMVILIMIFFFSLLFLGFPIAFCLMGTSVIFIALFVGVRGLHSVYIVSFRSLTIELWLAIPLFVFMATVFIHAGIGAQMYDAMYKWFAGLRGGLLVGTIAMSTLMAAITGLTSTAVLTMGVMGLPEMEKRGYSRFLTLGAIPFGGALGPIIPPSIIMIIVAYFAQQSVGKMFMGGVVPGLVMALLGIIYILAMCWVRPSLAPALPPAERAILREKLRSTTGLILPIGLIILILGTIYLGIATPTEAASVGAVGALLAAGINRKLNLAMLRAASIQAFSLNAMIMWLIFGGISMAAMFTLTGIGGVVEDFMMALDVSPMTVIWIMILIPVILGCFMDLMVVIILGLPIFIPIVQALGFDTLWFCVLFSIVITLGAITPPFGFVIFITKGISPPGVSMGEIYKAVIPFSLIMIFVLVLGVVWPPLITWLPGQMFVR